MSVGLQGIASAVGAGILVLLTGSQAAAQQCVPAVTNPSAYERCHLRTVRGQTVCRCAPVSAGLRRSGEARAAVAWGTLTAAASDWTSRSLTLEGYAPGISAAQLVSPSGPEGGDGSWRDSGGANGTNTVSASAAPGVGVAHAQGASAPSATATGSTPSPPEPGSAVLGLGIAGPNGSIRSDNIPAPVNP